MRELREIYDFTTPIVVLTISTGQKDKFINDSISNSDFVCFDDEEIIKYFNNLDWIIDYDGVKDLSLYKLILYSNNIRSKCNDLINKYDKMEHYDKIRNSNKKDDIKHLNIKWINIRDYILYRVGIIKYKLPSELKTEKRYIRNKKKNT